VRALAITSSSPSPAVLRDRDELVQRGFELLAARAVQPLAQHGQDRRSRPPVDEDDEAEPEAALVLAVEAGARPPPRLGLPPTLPGRRAGRERPRPDRRVRLQHLSLLLVGEPARHLAGHAERTLPAGEQLDEAGAALEELREFVLAQLPR